MSFLNRLGIIRHYVDCRKTKKSEEGICTAGAMADPWQTKNIVIECGL